MKLFRLNKTYSAVCQWVRTRSGFKHTADLFKNGYSVESAKCCYLNRTWERFEYETVLHELIDNSTVLTDKEKKRFKNKWR